ncbi:MAG: CPBP family intramembrane metalloprotease [Bacteroidales bacterium]|nr:CPBP family intramembrane metalloprotease [Bacteroidales bacterium]
MKPFRQIVVLLALSLAMGIISALMGPAATALGIDITSTANLMAVQAMSQLLMFVVPVVLVIAIYKLPVKSLLQLDFTASKWSDALAATIIMLLLVPACEALTQLNDAWHWGGPLAQLEAELRYVGEASQQILDQMLKRESTGALVANLIVIALMPALCEEIFFRGGLQQLTTRWLGNRHWAILITAAIFSIAHGDLFAFLPRFALGIALGYLFCTSGSILASASAHFANNALIVVLNYLNARGLISLNPEQPIEFGVIITILCTVGALALFFARNGQKILTKPTIKC